MIIRVAWCRPVRTPQIARASCSARVSFLGDGARLRFIPDESIHQSVPGGSNASLSVPARFSHALDCAWLRRSLTFVATTENMHRQPRRGGSFTPSMEEYTIHDNPGGVVSPRQGS